MSDFEESHSEDDETASENDGMFTTDEIMEALMRENPAQEYKLLQRSILMPINSNQQANSSCSVDENIIIEEIAAHAPNNSENDFVEVESVLTNIAPNGTCSNPQTNIFDTIDKEQIPFEEGMAVPVNDSQEAVQCHQIEPTLMTVISESCNNETAENGHKSIEVPIEEEQRTDDPDWQPDSQAELAEIDNDEVDPTDNGKQRKRKSISSKGE